MGLLLPMQSMSALGSWGDSPLTETRRSEADIRPAWGAAADHQSGHPFDTTSRSAETKRLRWNCWENCSRIRVRFQSKSYPTGYYRIRRQWRFSAVS